MSALALPVAEENIPINQNNINQSNVLKINLANSVNTNERKFKIPKEMLPQNEFEKIEFEVIGENSSTHEGMDEIPLQTLYQMLEYLAENNKWRNLAILVCQANWGMRFSDLKRVTVSDIVNENGEYKERFTLKGGEKKTGKVRYYYNNIAVMLALTLYFEKNNSKKKYYDFLFTSESNNKPKEENLEKKQKALTKAAGINIIKETLEHVGVYSVNRLDKTKPINCDKKYGTHSLRKTYGKYFHDTGLRLKELGQINVDMHLLQMLSLDFAHSSVQITERYFGGAEEMKEIICKNMNLGLEVLEKYEQFVDRN